MRVGVVEVVEVVGVEVAELTVNECL